ncbi:Serine/threonine protein kinase [Stigmatella aurantiaca]|uniref:non-specific serine/threonine protein kinase n=1 Tax=Stigmatella aurantiaca TaxID=41 RepID=A0A1H8FV26_STIAU|nr:serine/threonine-protein kinase [Stigmatella aurantiaca]SEN35593.1 Serine/threonine protein kinase [Stigmatella aurantiaca]
MFADFDPLDLKPGQMVSDWRIVRRIGRGGYAVVYEVEKDGERFALKVACQTERSLDPKQTDARAQREAACLGQVNHRNIIRMLAQGRWPGARSGFHYIVLEFVDGYTLAQWVERTNPTPHEVVVLFLKLFDALEHMHAKNVFHRDLSLRNIMVTKDGEPVIIDFGVADYATAEELTDGPLPPGTPRNRSPEAQQFWEANRLKPGARYTFKATDDIFALGANLYDVLTDPAPERSERRPVLNSMVVTPPTPHRKSKGRVPAELSAYAMKLISRDLEVRPATAKDARRLLSDLARHEGEDWREISIHPASAQLPREPTEGEPVRAEAREPEAPQELVPFHPLPVQVGPADAVPAPSPVQIAPADAVPAPSSVQIAPAPADAAPAPPSVQIPPAPAPANAAPVPAAAGAAVHHNQRRAWLRPVFVGPLALSLFAAVVAASLLHRPAQPALPPVARSAPADQFPDSSTLAEKPTSRPERLASPLPTQKEASPSVKLPDDSPTLTNGVPNPQQIQKASRRRVLSKVEKCGLLVASVAWLEAGCTGVQTRPDPEPCPEEAVKAMRELRWAVGGIGPGILLDVTKGTYEEAREQPLAVWKDGPVTGALIDPEGKAPAGMRIDGHLWTTGDRIYGRYVRAHLPGGRTVPICLELENGGELGSEKREGSKPGAPVASKVSSTSVVERWR